MICGDQKLMVYLPIIIPKYATIRYHTRPFRNTSRTENSRSFNFSCSFRASSAWIRFFSSSLRNVASIGRLGKQK
jgi:hypothetical protein